MKLAHWSAAVVLALASAASLAARPTSIVFESNAETADGQLYGQYTVNCTDGRSVTLTAWEGNSRWCLGEAGGRDCQQKQIRAAKSACEATTPGQDGPGSEALPVAAYSR
jgi:hypothetical protein